MEGFEKIEFNEKKPKSEAVPENRTGNLQTKSSLMDQKNGSFTMSNRRKTGGSKFKLKWSKKGGIALLVVLALLVLSGIPAYATYTSGLETYRHAKLLSAALKKQDIALASEEITKTKESLVKTQKKL